MPDWRTMHDSEYLFAFHLAGRDANVTIKRVAVGVLTGEGGRKSKKPVVWFEGKDLPLALCKTNCKTIAALYGNDVDRWVGKRITLYPTTTEFGRKEVECIRIRPKVPGQKPELEQPAAPQEPTNG